MSKQLTKTEIETIVLAKYDVLPIKSRTADEAFKNVVKELTKMNELTSEGNVVKAIDENRVELFSELFDKIDDFDANEVL